MNLKFVINRPTTECDPHSIHIGPTAVDFSMLERMPVPVAESKLIAQWKEKDLADFYHRQQGNRRNRQSMFAFG